jgi:two-component system nitrate/nitrite response regulator NarL
VVPSIALVEDHQLLAETLAATFVQRGIDTAIVPPDEPAALLHALQRSGAGLVLLDLDLGAHGDGTCVIAPLAAAGIRTLVVSGSTDRERIAIAFEAGAFGYHAKADGFSLLVTKAVDALGSVAPLDESLRRELRDELARTRRERSNVLEPFGRLTERERNTLLALSTGLSVNGIATEWVVSEATVRSHVRGVLAKLDAPSQLAAVALALRSGWLPVAS